MKWGHFLTDLQVHLSILVAMATRGQASSLGTFQKITEYKYNIRGDGFSVAHHVPEQVVIKIVTASIVFMWVTSAMVATFSMENW